MEAMTLDDLMKGRAPFIARYRGCSLMIVKKDNRGFWRTAYGGYFDAEAITAFASMPELTKVKKREVKP